MMHVMAPRRTPRRTTAHRSRREEYSDATRAALVDSATTLFTERGYTDTSLDAIVSAARVTKGALYHHFGRGKKELFEAAFYQAQDDVHERLTATMSGPETPPWEAARQGLRAFLDCCLEPVYRRIVWQEAPHVLGFGAWWDCEQRYALGIIRSMVQRLIDAGEIEPLPVDPLARTLSGGLAGAATAIGEADDPETVRAEFEQVIARTLRGLRAGADGA